MAEYKQAQRSLRLIVATLTLALSSVSTALMADEAIDQGNESLATPASVHKTRELRRAAYAPALSEETVRLLASIPDDHPLKAELRRIALSEPPAGYSAEQWLRLAMKFDFRTPGSAEFRGKAQGF